jgi:hypothetical protein
MLEIKNKVAIIYFLTYVIRQLHVDKLQFNISIKSLLTSWDKKREIGKELFYKPSTGLKRMWGDCDDFVTVMAAKLNKLKINYKIGFLIKNNGAYHVFIVTNENVLLDPWVSRKPIKFKKEIYKKAENIVLYDINFKENIL